MSWSAKSTGIISSCQIDQVGEGCTSITEQCNGSEDSHSTYDPSAESASDWDGDEQTMFVSSKLPENAEMVDEKMMAMETRSDNEDTMVAVSGSRSAATTGGKGS